METIKRILIISRIIPYSKKTIKYGMSLARKHDATLYILHLVSNPVDMLAVNVPELFHAQEYKNFENSQQEARGIWKKLSIRR